MPTTGDVLDQHLKCFGKNDLDGVLADYSSDAGLFVPGKQLKGRTQSSLFPRLSFRSLQSLARRFRCGSDTLRVTTLTFCGAPKQQTIRTKPPLTRSWCRTGRSCRSPLLPRLPRKR